MGVLGTDSSLGILTWLFVVDGSFGLGLYVSGRPFHLTADNKAFRARPTAVNIGDVLDAWDFGLDLVVCTGVTHVDIGVVWMFIWVARVAACEVTEKTMMLMRAFVVMVDDGRELRFAASVCLTERCWGDVVYPKLVFSAVKTCCHGVSIAALMVMMTNVLGVSDPG